MRLLHTTSDGRLKWTRDYVGNEEIPDYAILSHTWKAGEEVTFDDMKTIDNTKDIDAQSSEGYRKLRFCAQQAKRDGLNYFWIDTCCIDKSNSSELHEAINSMFQWYKNAKKCYVFLSDVESNTLNGDSKSAFMKSKWFTRGWTLQELLAPQSVDFFSREGERLGDKESLRDIIQETTRLPRDALSGKQMSEFSTDERFSWADRRQTTRPEDGAYCLLGIFDIHLPLIYGEGKHKALRRLRKEIRESVEGVANVPVNDADFHNRSHEDRVYKIYNWLSAPDPSTNYHRAHKQRQAETGLWLLESAKFTEWKEGAASRLWLYGIPGCGKTILSSTIIENLLQHCHDNPGMAIAYFYFDFNDAQKQDPELMVRSLFCQLMPRLVTYPGAIDALFSSCENGRRQPSLHALLGATKQVMQQLTHVYIVLDALDECTQRAELIDLLTTVAGWQLANMHLLMTSRKERDIESSLETYVKEEDTICLQRDVVDNDIQLYVQQRLSDDKELAKWNKDPSVRQEIEAAIMGGARGMFRWAVCQLDTLAKCRNRAMLRKSLANLPQTLDQTYDRILSAISEDDCKYAVRILQWLAFSVRPLSVEEVAEVAAIDAARSPAFDRDEVLEDPLEAFNICSSLVTLTTVEDEGMLQPSQRIIALAHYSVREYLVSDRIKQGQAKQYSMREVECHTAITRGSLEYLNQFHQPLSSEIFETSALARYSAEFWSSHLRMAGEQIEGMSQLVMSLLSAERTAYHVWIQLYDPDNPWMGPNLGKSLEHVAAPLYYAALLGLSTITKLLLDEGAQVDAKGGRWGNALQAASYGGHEQVVKVLLDSKADVNGQGGPYGNALHAAVAEGHEAMVKILLAGGADIKGVDAQLKSVMHHAVNNASCKPSLVSLLLDRGAPPNTLDVDNMTPLHYSVKFGHKSIAETLLARGIPINAGVHRKIWHSRTIGKHTVYEEFLSVPLPQLGTQPAGLTPLHFAALTGNPVMTQFLLQHGAEPNALSDYGETPLHLTLRKTLHGVEYRDDWTDSSLRAECLWDLLDFDEDDVDAVRADINRNRTAVLRALLSDPRTDLMVKDHQSEHALHFVPYEDAEGVTVLRELVSRGADPFCSNSKQQTALHLACGAGDSASVLFLLSHNADTASVDHEGLNAFHYAARSGDHETIAIILDDAKDKTLNLVTTRDSLGRNALHHLLSTTSLARVETVQMLLVQEVDGSELDSSGMSPLARYVMGYSLWIDIHICRLLFLVEGSSSFVNEDGQTLGHLHASSFCLGVEVLKTLKDHGVDLMQKDLHGRTILHCATISGFLDERSLGFMLHVVGIQLDAKDVFAKTAAQYATELARDNINQDMWDTGRWNTLEKILLRAGANSSSGL